jgi:hypothetical protein
MTDRGIVNINEDDDLDLDALFGDGESADADPGTEPGFNFPSKLEMGIAYRKAKERVGDFVSNPRNLAATGAGALMLGGLELARRSNVKDKKKKKPGFLKRTLGTTAGLGLAGAGAYSAYKLMNKKPVSENTNPYGTALKPSSVLGGTGALAAGLAAFPVADALTAGIPNEGLRAAANIGAKALLSTVGSGLAGYGGYKAGREIEKAQTRAQEKEYKKRNQYLPDFYYNNVG